MRERERHAIADTMEKLSRVEREDAKGNEKASRREEGLHFGLLQPGS